ncbi:methyl-accepting chemotaxis protein [Salidesulfovibrio brasiliensis]|uniref:methyl-accepting chemotaxis protein n=1 Tax=Salidesulfovibrio brasiliensis TaxID=221711 RepID=UPI0006D215F5|nr:methyl-accepting chemotaxis protein [Salidesulfovibrio brasiliensis]
MFNWVTRSLARTIILPVVGAIIAGVAALVLYVNNTTTALVYESESSAAQEIASSIRSSLDMFISDSVSLAKGFSNNVTISMAATTGQGDSARKVLKDSVAGNKSLWGALIFNKDGVIVSGYGSDGTQFEGVNIASRPYVSNILSGADSYVSKTIFKAKTGDTLLFAVSVPVYNAQNELAGGIALLGDWAAFTSRFIDPIKVGHEGYAFMLDSDGRFIYHPINKGVILENHSSKDFVRQAMNRGNGVISYKWDGEDKILIFRTEPVTGWIICLGAYESDITSGAIRQGYVLSGIGTAVAFIVIAIVIFFMRRLVVAPVSEGMNAAGMMARGDLTQDIESDSPNELGNLMRSLASMIEALRTVVYQVKSSAEMVAAGSEEVSASAEEMADSSTEQASSVEEVAASVEEMSANITQNLHTVERTRDIAVRTAKDATEGGEAVKQTVKAMRDIADRTSIIEEIARQTNLLALNAAIEAARAGEHGKGFAVVAAEVRKLAERSGVAANEISDLTGNSLQVAEKAGSMLEKVVADIKTTEELVQEVTAASQDQQSAAEQISTAIGHLDMAVQKNTSFSEELSATAQELSAQAVQLQEAMEFFTVNGHSPQAARQTKTKAKPAVARTVQRELPESDDWEQF